MFLAADLKGKWMRIHHYVGGHVSSMTILLCYNEPKVANCVHAVEVLARITAKYP